MHPATYKDHDRVWLAYSSHPQVDTGLGFTCDAGVKDIVIALNKAGWETCGSCESVTSWAIPRRQVSFTNSDHHQLLDFCLYLKSLIPKSGFQQRMYLDNYYAGEPVFVVLEYVPELESLLMQALETFKTHALE